MSGKYDDNIGLFPNKKRQNENSPHFTGSVVVSRETLSQLVQKAKAGQEAKLGAAAWVNAYEGGKRINVKIRPWEDRTEQQPQQSRPAPQSDGLMDMSPAVNTQQDDFPF